MGTGLPVTVREAGHGPPVLLLHGVAGPGSMKSLIDHLAVRLHVIAPTHPGFDGTVRTDDLDGVADLAAIYLDLLAQRQSVPATVIGVSFGGWVAAEMAAADAGHRVGRLALIDAVGPHIPGYRPIMPSGPPPSAGPLPGTPRQGPSPGNLAALQAYSSGKLEDPTLLDRMRRVRAPTLLIWGETDTVVTPDFGRRYADAIRNSRFVLIPGAGHLPMRDAPEATFASIDAFLKDTIVQP